MQAVRGNKKQRSDLALLHTENMERLYGYNIGKSVQNSKIYTKNYNFKHKDTSGSRVAFEVEPCDTVSALLYLSQGSDVALLNFASFFNPGGGFLKGSVAQEEALCGESYLYNVLRRFKSFYETNKEIGNKNPLKYYENRAIYSPEVLFFRGKLRKTCSVITCASPNKKASMGKEGYSEVLNRLSLQSRIKFVLDIAAENNVKTLILGAFGCGVFGQNPYEVATIFKEYLNKDYGCFEKVIFAIPDENSTNFKEFYKVFNGSM